MVNRLFSEVLREAIAGQPVSTEAVIARFMPLVSSRSIMNGKLDEDMRQYILMRVIMLLPKFDPDKKY